MFERPHHQRIATVLNALDGRLLQDHNCLFGGGTAMALRHGEYRESVDIDFLVSEIGSYRALRQLLTGVNGVAAIVHAGTVPFIQAREVRADQYGIRTMLRVAEQPIKFEIVLEGRIALLAPTASDEVCGIATLTQLDMATSKLLANSDRWADDGVFGRDLQKALQGFQDRHGWLERCMQAMSINLPKALVWKKLRALRACLPKETSGGQKPI